MACHEHKICKPTSPNQYRKISRGTCPCLPAPMQTNAMCTDRCDPTFCNATEYGFRQNNTTSPTKEAPRVPSAGLNTTHTPMFCGWLTCTNICWTTLRGPLKSSPILSGKLESSGHILIPTPPWRSCRSPVRRMWSSSLPKLDGSQKTSSLVHQGKRGTPRWERRASLKSGLHKPTMYSYDDLQEKGRRLRSDNRFGYTWHILTTCNVRLMMMMRAVSGVLAAFPPAGHSTAMHYSAAGRPRRLSASLSQVDNTNPKVFGPLANPQTFADQESQGMFTTLMTAMAASDSTRLNLLLILGIRATRMFSQVRHEMNLG